MSILALRFNVETLSLMDINDLIDKGKRFTLMQDTEGKGVLSVEEYLNGAEVNVSSGRDGKLP